MAVAMYRKRSAWLDGVERVEKAEADPIPHFDLSVVGGQPKAERKFMSYEEVFPRQVSGPTTLNDQPNADIDEGESDEVDRPSRDEFTWGPGGVEKRMSTTGGVEWAEKAVTHNWDYIPGDDRFVCRGCGDAAHRLVGRENERCPGFASNQGERDEDHDPGVKKAGNNCATCGDDIADRGDGNYYHTGAVNGPKVERQARLHQFGMGANGGVEMISPRPVEKGSIGSSYRRGAEIAQNPTKLIVNAEDSKGNYCASCGRDVSAAGGGPANHEYGCEADMNRVDRRAASDKKVEKADDPCHNPNCGHPSSEHTRGDTYACAHVNANGKPCGCDVYGGSFEKADYPWDQCMADNEPKYGKEGAAKVCGSIKAKYGKSANWYAKAEKDIMDPSGWQKCRECGKRMNPVDALVGNGGGDQPICGKCVDEGVKRLVGKAMAPTLASLPTLKDVHAGVKMPSATGDWLVKGALSLGTPAPVLSKRVVSFTGFTKADPICATCQTPTDKLALFPGGVCVDCWAKTPEGRRMPTADELVSMWGGKPVKKALTGPTKVDADDTKKHLMTDHGQLAGDVASIEDEKPHGGVEEYHDNLHRIAQARTGWQT